MTDHLTTGLLNVGGLRWRLGGSHHGGGESIFGESQTRRTDGGGRWFADVNGIHLFSDARARVYEALLLDWNNGNEKMIVHRLATPLLLGADTDAVPFSDDTTFSDGTAFVGGEVNAELVGAAAHRATTISVRVWGARPMEGAEPFTIVGPTKGDRLYGAARILSSTADGAATVYSLRISPPLREAIADGTHIDFNRPRCTMRIDMTADEMWPTYEPGWLARTNIRLSETFKP